MTTDPITIEEGEVPPDIPPDFTPPPSDPDSPENPANWFDPQYPYSTQQHPYGFFPVSATDPAPDYDRPRKRRPHKRGSHARGVAVNTMATDKQARTAAALLARFNGLFGIGVAVFLPMTARELAKANVEFEEMAYQALLNDPELCKRIMAAGTTSGRAQLALAYVMLGGALAPCAWQEVKERREVVNEQGERVA